MEKIIKDLTDFIETNSDKYFAYPGDRFINRNALLDHLKQLKSSLPKPVEVPEFVGEWIEHCRKRSWDLRSAMSFENFGNFTDKKKLKKWFLDGKGKNELFARAWLDGYTVIKEPLYWAVKGVTDYFQCDGKVIAFTKEEEAVEVANLIGINTRVEKLESRDNSDCVLIGELRETMEDK